MSNQRCPSRRYACANKEINRDYLESYVVGLIEREILNISSLHKIRQSIEKHAIASQEPIKNHIEQEREEIETAIKNVADAIESGLISEALVERMRELEKRKAELIKLCIREKSKPVDANVDPSLLLTEFAEVKCAPSSPMYRDFMRNFVDRIDVGSYTVKITLKTGLDIFPELNQSYEVRRQEIYERRKTV